MLRIAIGAGGALVVLGLAGYLGSGRESITALIPTFLGLPVLVLALLARGQPETRGRGLLLAISLLALLGFLGAARGLPALAVWIGGGEVERPVAVALQSAMAILCAGLAAGGIIHVLARRRSRD